ncbi:MAG: Zinc-binding alcohol dehydrogenase [Acidimicrobiales bacterium]|nr:Zinc-binding alcohol dehydrogenase [Acidimicrobiales bacterium]
MKALRFERSLARFAAARVAGTLAPGRGAKVGPLRLVDVDPPALPGPGWHVVRPRLTGICGSDLATVDGMSSRYFEPIVSFPFIPGHEVVGELDDGTRVVVEPVLHCAIRGIDPVCPWCAAGQTNRCERVAFGHLEPGLQSGYCEDTGGGWSTFMVAHDAQLHRVPDDLTDEEAVMVEPTACAVHAAAAHPGVGLTVVLGAGTIGLCTIAALRHADVDGPVIAVAKHPDQKRLARSLGADVVCAPDELTGVVRRQSGSMHIGHQLTGGADHVFDCVGNSDSITQSLHVVAPGGTIHLVGMPGNVSVDLTGLWHREVSISGRYAYTHAEFERAFDVVRDAGLGKLVSATYPLDDFTTALQHAAEAGRRGAVKIAFDLRNEKERNR